MMTEEAAAARHHRFAGTTVALVTPFRPDGSVDHDALADLVTRAVAAGVEGVLACGTTGEGVTLSPRERGDVLRTVSSAARGGAAVMAGVGGSDTLQACRAAEVAARAGADAVLALTPAYNKPPQEGLVRHFRAVAAAAGVDVVLYNVPGRTSVDLLPESVFDLAATPGIVGIKEASGSVARISTLVSGRPPGFLVLSGDDELTLPAVAAGADGVVSVVANEAPGEMASLVRAARSGDVASARALHLRLLPLMRANFLETNPIPVKAALALMGLAPDRVRLPLVPAAEATRRELRRALAHASLLAREAA